MNYKNTLSELLINIGKKIRERRKELGMTQQDLGFYSDCDRATISKLETFQSDNVTLRELIKICTALRITIKKILI